MSATGVCPVVLVAGLLAGCADHLPILPRSDARPSDGASGADGAVADAAAGDAQQGDAQPRDAGATDAMAGICWSDEDCVDEAFCRFESGCGADGPGSCMVRPRICTRELAWVCACDGNSYTNACQAFAAGVSVWGFGRCGCEALLGVYQAAVAVAKRCDPETDRVHCDFTVDEDLLCGCPTTVEDSPEALEALRARLSQAYYEGGLGCPVVDCAGCLPLVGGECEGQSSAGHCEDRFE